MRRRATEDDYTERINRVMNVIAERLDSPPSLAQLARVAAFSPFHFHRVFRGVTGETVHGYVMRCRVERAALLLGRGSSTRRLTDLALELGFSSGAELSRAFRARFGVTPSGFRREKRKNPQGPLREGPYRRGHERTLRVTVVERLERTLAFIRITAPFETGRLEHAGRRLLDWATRQGLSTTPLLGLSHDDPDVVALAKCRYDLALETARSGHGVSTRTLPTSTWAELRVEGTPRAMEHGWSWLFSHWLPSSGYEPGALPGVERYEHGLDLARWSAPDVVLCLPLR
ncbi:MAG: AraC family transcriptional regulator [Myxococcaceae bacterium]|nr:AraC family transcriptional regulator [Myxococcaceae bacterium]